MTTPFFSEDVIEFYLTELYIRQQTADAKKPHADTLCILYTLNMQYTFLNLIASIILGVYGCGK